MLPVREVFQDCFRIVADRREFDALFFESRLSGLQLDQLPFAVGSPIGGAIEDEHRAVRSHDGITRPGFAVLIFQAEIGHNLADLRT